MSKQPFSQLLFLTRRDASDPTQQDYSDYLGARGLGYSLTFKPAKGPATDTPAQPAVWVAETTGEWPGIVGFISVQASSPEEALGKLCASVYDALMREAGRFL